MSKFTIYVFIIIFAVTGCTPVIMWTQAGVSDEKSLADLSSCETQARQTTARPQPTPAPAFGDGQLPSADKALVNDLTDFFTNQILVIEARNADIGLDIGFGTSEFGLLRDELERNFAGEVIYERNSKSLGIKDTFLRVLSVLSTTPKVNLLELWEQADEENPFTLKDEITTDSASAEALARYDQSVDDYLYEMNLPLRKQYEIEISRKVDSCMQALGYQPRN